MSDTCDLRGCLIQDLAFGAQKCCSRQVELEVFTALSGKKLTGEELGSKLGLHPRDVWDFFNTLVALRFLERDGDGREARYKNTAETALYLDKHSPAYIGGFKVTKSSTWPVPAARRSRTRRMITNRIEGYQPKGITIKPILTLSELDRDEVAIQAAP